MGAKLREDTIGAEQEHAAVPAVACREQGFGDGQLRLFHEARDAARRRLSKGRAGADVAVAGLGAGRRDAEGDEVACPGHRQREVDRPQQRRGIRDQVIRRTDPQRRRVRTGGGRRAPPARSRPRYCVRMARAAAARRGRGHLGQLGAHQEVVGLCAYRDDLLGRGAREQPPCRLLRQGLAADELRQLLGQGRAAHRPRRVPAPPPESGTSRVAMVTAPGPIRTCGSYRPAQRRSSPPRGAIWQAERGDRPTASTGGLAREIALLRTRRPPISSRWHARRQQLIWHQLGSRGHELLSAGADRMQRLEDRRYC